MDLLIGCVIIVIVAAAISGSICYNRGYWRGRNGGCKAIENMVLERAQEHEDYSTEKVWKDLLQ